MALLTTLASVKSYLAIPGSGSDALIQQLIPVESAAIERFCSRKFSPVSVSKYFDGTGNDFICPEPTPIATVDSVTVLGNTATPASADGIQAGYIFDENAIYLVGGPWTTSRVGAGGCFPRGRQNVLLAFTSGFVGTETDAVPGSTTYTILPVDMGRAIQAISVTAADGSTRALATGAPGAGHFALDASTGTFTFNSADANVVMTLKYYAVPWDVQQTCNEMIGLDLKQRDNLGISSKSLAGESITYQKTNMDAGMKATLQPYVKRWLG